MDSEVSTPQTSTLHGVQLWLVLPAESANVGQPLQAAMNDRVVVTAMVREGVRQLNPDAGTIMAGEDILVLFGSLEDLDRAERALLQ